MYNIQQKNIYTSAILEEIPSLVDTIKKMKKSLNEMQYDLQLERQKSKNILNVQNICDNQKFNDLQNELIKQNQKINDLQNELHKQNQKNIYYETQNNNYKKILINNKINTLNTTMNNMKVLIKEMQVMPNNKIKNVYDIMDKFKLLNIYDLNSMQYF